MSNPPPNDDDHHRANSDNGRRCNSRHESDDVSMSLSTHGNRPSSITTSYATRGREFRHSSDGMSPTASAIDSSTPSSSTSGNAACGHNSRHLIDDVSIRSSDHGNVKCRGRCTNRSMSYSRLWRMVHGSKVSSKWKICPLMTVRV